MTWALLVSLLAKSSLVAGAGLVCARRLTRDPVERVDILRGAVCLLLALPVIMNVLPPLELALLPPLDIPAAPAVVAASSSPAPPPPPWWTSPGAILGGLWLLGAALVSGHLVVGLDILRRWTRKGRPVTAPEWLAPLARLPSVDRPGLVASDHVAGPISWGVAPGAILLDPATLSEPQGAPAIMAHELAHLRRHDWIFLILSRVVLAIFWFNPLVWRLHAALAERSEEAADAIAVGSVDRALYAQTLVRLAASPAPFVAALPMAANARTLKTRIACLMTQAPDRRRPLTVAVTIAALAVVATPLAAFGLSRQASPPIAPSAVAPASPVAVARVQPPAEVAEAAEAAPAAAAEPAAPVAPPPPPPPPPPVAPVAPVPPVATADSAADAYDLASAKAQAAWSRAQARAEADWSRSMAEAARVNAEQIRREVEAHRGEIEAAARLAAQQARLSAEDARRIGEEARQAGERARVEAIKVARVQMAQGAVQMRAGARQMREEAARLGDPAYRARQIEDNRARGNTVTDQELQDVARRLPRQADDLERQADKLAAQAKDMS